ncbi:MAG TPA: aminotransferase class V-fold PLP-dependent enzyme [Leptolyngbyaceae cyanobacterium M65_K2018_010]|nr:aminotransferase class V-fold PLP-dependent enzyme [Leptolyngbyaceae cyanobacterium M65_K2018_010]
MSFPVLPTTAFVDPFGQNRAAIEDIFQTVTQAILNHLTQAGKRAPLPQPVTTAYPAIPEQPGAIADLLAPLQTIMAESMNPAHPGYLGHMDPLPTTASILGDWVAAALNNNMLSVEMSPVLSRLEPLLMAEMAQIFGLGDRAGGLLVSGGTLANLQALTLARNVKLGCGQSGLARQPSPLILASEMAHSSIQKAAMILGLGLEGVGLVPTNANAQMQPDALETLIRAALAEGKRPFAVVATAGTTVTGNIDPLVEIHRIAQAYDLWFHVDAAYGGAIAFSPTHRHRLAGIEQADSITFNPQKWLYVTKTCASVLFRDMALLDSHFRIAAPYMNAEPRWTNLGEISVQGTRHPDVLKLWLSLQHLGKAGYAALVDGSYALTAVMVEHLRQRSDLSLATEPEMNLVCFRGCPPHLAPDRWDGWNAQAQQRLLKQAQVFLSLPRLRGHLWLKAVLLNPFTTAGHLAPLFDQLDDWLRQG